MIATKNAEIKKKSPTVDHGPWSASSFRRNALTDLTEIAAAMHSRGRDPHEIELALARQAALWRMYGADVPDGAPLAIIRCLPGLSDYDPFAGIDPDALAEGIELPSDVQCERRRRAFAAAKWLIRHAGSASAEVFVRSGERGLVAQEGRS